MLFSALFLGSKASIGPAHVKVKVKVIMLKGVVPSYQIWLILPSVAETHPKIHPSRCNLKFSICRHAGGMVSSLGNHHSLF